MLLSGSAKLDANRARPMSQLSPYKWEETSTNRLQKIHALQTEHNRYSRNRAAVNPNRFADLFHLKLYDAEICNTSGSFADLHGAHDAESDALTSFAGFGCLLSCVQETWKKMNPSGSPKLLDIAAIQAIAVVTEEIMYDVFSGFISRIRGEPIHSQDNVCGPLVQLSYENSLSGSEEYLGYLTRCFTSSALNNNFRDSILRLLSNHLTVLFGVSSEGKVRAAIKSHATRERSLVINQFRRLSLQEHEFVRKRRKLNMRFDVGFARRKNFVGYPKFIRDLRKGS